MFGGHSTIAYMAWNMGVMAIARGRVRRRIVKVVTVTAGWRSRLRLSRTAGRPGRPAGRQLQA
jgi:hypothetical protein